MENIVSIVLLSWIDSKKVYFDEESTVTSELLIFLAFIDLSITILDYYFLFTPYVLPFKTLCLSVFLLPSFALLVFFFFFKKQKKDYKLSLIFRFCRFFFYECLLSFCRPSNNFQVNYGRKNSAEELWRN